MKIISLLLAVLILFSGCTSVAGVHRGLNTPREVEKGVYTIRVPDYGKNEKATKYAINEFVKSKKGESYDMELIQSPTFWKSYYEYKITIPGSIAVENLPKVRVFDSGATETLIYIIGTPIVLLLIIGFFGWIGSGI